MSLRRFEARTPQKARPGPQICLRIKRPQTHPPSKPFNNKPPQNFEPFQKAGRALLGGLRVQGLRSLRDFRGVQVVKVHPPGFQPGGKVAPDRQWRKREHAILETGCQT